MRVRSPRKINGNRQQAGRQAKGAGQDNDSDEDGSVQFEFEPGTTQIQARVR